MEPKSILEHIGEHDVVTVHNPMSDDFTWPVATSVVARPNRSANQTGNSGADAFMSGLNSGIDAGGHVSMMHTSYPIEVKSGQTMRMPGDIAKVFVRHLVKEMMQRMGDKKRMADPHAVMEYERKVVLNHKSMLDNLSLETAEEKVTRQLAELNATDKVEVEQESEQAFPEIGADTGAVAPGGEEPSEPARRGPGRPRAKAD